MTVEHNADVVVPGLNPDLPSTPENPTGNLNPAVAGALEEGNTETGGDLDDAEEDAKKAKKAASDLDENEEDNEKKGRGIGTELSADGGSRGGGSPMLGGGSPMGQPMSQPMSQPSPSMPQMSMPQTQMPNASNMMKLPPGAMDKLLSGYNPKSDSKDDWEKALSDARVSGADELSPDEVRYDKTGIGPLTDSELSAVIEEALDKNGVTKDPKIRAQWHELYEFMAQKESSRNPDAINLHDSNARNYPNGPWSQTRASDGHPTMCSRGVWQTIPSTFATYHVAGTSMNIYDPLASAAASVNYVLNDPKYNVGRDGTGLQEFYSDRMRGGYTGY